MDSKKLYLQSFYVEDIYFILSSILETPYKLKLTIARPLLFAMSHFQLLIMKNFNSIIITWTIAILYLYCALNKY